MSRLDEPIQREKMDRDKLSVIKPKVDDVIAFFETNNSEYFRYFQKREYNIISRHLYTALYLYDRTVFGYGHIDFENYNWLGVFIKEEFRGKNLSSYLLNDLLKNCKEDVYLTVDLENIIAYNIYKKFGFKVVDKQDRYYLMVYKQ